MREAKRETERRSTSTRHGTPQQTNDTEEPAVTLKKEMKWNEKKRKEKKRKEAHSKTVHNRIEKEKKKKTHYNRRQHIITRTQSVNNTLRK